jgi:hypothetical protein
LRGGRGSVVENTRLVNVERPEILTATYRVVVTSVYAVLVTVLGVTVVLGITMVLLMTVRVNLCVCVDLGTTLMDLDPYLVWHTTLDDVDARDKVGARESARSARVGSCILMLARLQ